MTSKSNQARVESGYRLSPRQSRLLSIEYATNGRADTVVLLESGDPVDPAALREKLQRKVEAYEALRTRFALLDGASVAVQVVDEQQSPRVEWIPAVREEHPESTLIRALDTATSGNDGGVEPTLSVFGVQLASGGSMLLCRISAACADVTSVEGIVQACLEESEVPAESVVQLADLAEWEHEIAVGPAVEPRVLECGSSPGPLNRLRVPIDGIAPAVDRVAALSRVAPESFLLAVWLELISRRTGCASVASAVSVDRRAVHGLDGVVGPLTDSSLVRVTLPSAFRSLVSDVDRKRRRISQSVDCDVLASSFSFDVDWAVAEGELRILGSWQSTDLAEVKLYLRRAGTDLFVTIESRGKSLDRQAARCLAREFESLLRERIEEVSVSNDDMEPVTGGGRILEETWKDLLGVDVVGPDDDFFELGGDSILAIQMVARLGSQGWSIRARDVVANPRFGDLAVRIRRPSSEPGSGPLEASSQADSPPTPIQSWFFGLDATLGAGEAKPDHSHLAMSAITPGYGEFEREVMEAAWQAVVAHHPTLRSRFFVRDGRWRQKEGYNPAAEKFRQVDLGALSPDVQDEKIAEAADAIQREFSIEKGDLVRLVRFDLGGKRRARLLFAIQHLVVDGVSFRVLAEDLMTAASQIARSEPVILPAATTSMARWASALEALTVAGEFANEAPFWMEQAGARVGRLPDERGSGAGPDLEKDIEVFQSQLSKQTTHALVRDVPKCGERVREVLISGLLRVLARWSGDDGVQILLEGHGREEIAADIDLSRSIGWFTCLYPMIFAARRDRPFCETLESVRERMERLPNGGLGHGALLEFSPDAALQRALANGAVPEVNFDYLGRFDGYENAAEVAFEVTRAPEHPRTFRLEVTAAVTGDHLKIRWGYSRKRYSRSTIERLGAELMSEITAGVDALIARES